MVRQKEEDFQSSPCMQIAKKPLQCGLFFPHLLYRNKKQQKPVHGTVIRQKQKKVAWHSFSRDIIKSISLAQFHYKHPFTRWLAWRTGASRSQAAVSTGAQRRPGSGAEGPEGARSWQRRVGRAQRLPHTTQRLSHTPLSAAIEHCQQK